MRKLGVLLWVCIGANAYAQDIQMNFPFFKGKTYDFIIFQGTESKTVAQGTIPEDGKFTLHIPAEYAPYTGMSRWLITGTKEGGGLDMLIPGHDFSVSCTVAVPTNEAIIYNNNPAIAEQNKLFMQQQEIFAKHDAMLQATKAYPSTDKNYSLYQTEYQKQIEAYDDLQKQLAEKNDYASKFLVINNITRGIGTKIITEEKAKAENVADYITHQLDWGALYTSGYWATIINAWIAIESQVIDNPKRFASDFAEISKKIKDPISYNDFVKRISVELNRLGKDNLTQTISPIIRQSGKVHNYDGALAVYDVGREGDIAPDLYNSDGKVILKSKAFAGKQDTKTLLVFYRSDCGNCQELMQNLQSDYKNLSGKSLRVISISGDLVEQNFKDYSKNFPWKDSYHDTKGTEGINFKNYGVIGTPTIFLIDKDGKILLRRAALADIRKSL